MKNTYNSHHKQLVNRQGFNTDAVKSNNHVGLIVNFDFTSMMQPNEKSFSSIRGFDPSCYYYRISKLIFRDKCKSVIYNRAYNLWKCELSKSKLCRVAQLAQ